MKDRNFDDIAEKFSRNIYGTTKGAIRQAVLWQDLTALLAHLPQRPLRILDAGGGEGQMACQLAALEHQVLLCDVSDEMLKRAKATAQEKEVSHNIRFIHSPVQKIAEHLQHPVELILFHAVLEWVVQPRQVLELLYAILEPGGSLSLMFFNANGLVMRNALLGNFRLAAGGVGRRRPQSLSPQYPLDPQEVYSWLLQMGMTIRGKTGVRIFHDYLQNKQQQKDDFAELLALEQHYCRQEPFVNFGRYVHVIASKPNLKDEP